DRGGRWPWRRGTAQSARDIVRPAEGTMRQGFRVIDSDTHVNPSLDVLLRYADNELKQRIDDLQPYRRTVKTVPGRGDAEDVGSSTILSVRPVRLQRVAGERGAPATPGGGARHLRTLERPYDQGARARGLGGGGVAALTRGDADRRSRPRAHLGGRRRGRSADHVPRVYDRNAVLPGLSGHLGQPRDGPLRR